MFSIHVENTDEKPLGQLPLCDSLVTRPCPWRNWTTIGDLVEIVVRRGLAKPGWIEALLNRVVIHATLVFGVLFLPFAIEFLMILARGN